MQAPWGRCVGWAVGVGVGSGWVVGIGVGDGWAVGVGVGVGWAVGIGVGDGWAVGTGVGVGWAVGNSCPPSQATTARIAKTASSPAAASSHLFPMIIPFLLAQVSFLYCFLAKWGYFTRPGP